MKTITPQLAAFLASARRFVMADLYTFSLPSGFVWRCTDAAYPQKDMDGNIYAPIDVARNGIRCTTGVEVSELEMTFHADLATLVNGNALIQFAVNGGFDNAVVTLHRAYKADWDQPLQGVLNMFSGRVSQPRGASRTSIVIIAKSWLELLNVNVPPNVYQPPCKNVLYDGNCLADRSAFLVNNAATAGSTTSAIQTTLAQASGYFDLGSITFTSGLNNGISRTVKRHTGGGQIALVRAFPSAPAPGDTFNIVPGCDRRQVTCDTKFNNLIHFRGYPFVPVPETSV